MPNHRCFFFSLLLASLPLAGLLAAAPMLEDPGIPEEQSVYSSECNNQVQKITEVLYSRVVDGKEVYLDTFRSPDLDRYLMVEKATFKVLATHTVRHGAEAEVETIQLVREKQPKQRPNELRVSDYYGLRFLLRGYPFDKPRSLEINQLNGQDDISMYVKYLATEPMELMGKMVNCIKLELSFSGVVGAFLPKTQLWYLKAEPHYLVCYQGASEFNRKLKCRTKLISYTTR